MDVRFCSLRPLRSRIGLFVAGEIVTSFSTDIFTSADQVFSRVEEDVTEIYLTFHSWRYLEHDVQSDIGRGVHFGHDESDSDQ